jgi:ribosomal protein L35AE/L33A
VANKTSTTFTILSSTGTDATLPQATITEAGLLNSADKTTIQNLATVATSGDYADLSGIPSTFTPSAHTHVISDVTGLQTTLDGKFNNPIGDTTQYIAGDGSLVAFPIAGQAGTLVRQVRNETGSTITKGTVVYISGASGNKALVSKGLATSDATSAQTFGVVQADIPTNNNGYVVVRGDLIGINTSAYLDGTQLYLSGSVAGTFTSTKPVAPIHMVYVGVVTRQHATQGQVEVAIQNGYEMDELHDVLIVSKANKDVISYDSVSGLWKNKQLATSDVVGLDTTLSSKQPLATVLTNTTASFTTTLETKLNGIASGAGVNVNADWEFIKTTSSTATLVIPE